MIALLDFACQLLAQVLRFAIVALRPARTVAAENLFLRRQLAMYMERGWKPTGCGDPRESCYVMPGLDKVQ